jgi:hypothetical protein
MNLEKFFSMAVFSNPATTWILAVVTPYVFTWSVNYDRFDLEQLFFSLMVLAVFSVLILLFSIGMKKLLKLVSLYLLPSETMVTLSYYPQSSKYLQPTRESFSVCLEKIGNLVFLFFCVFLAGKSLVFLFPDLFHFFHNDDMFMHFMAGGVFLLSGMLFYTSHKKHGAFLETCILYLSNMTNKKLSDDFFMVILAISAVALSFLVFCLFSGDLESVFLLLLILLLSMHGKLIRLLNIMAFSFLILSFFSLSYGMISVYYNHTSEGNSHQSGDGDVILPSIEFKHRPNVYLFILESYHNRDVLKNVYGLDISDFENFLKDKNFVIYDDAVSRNGETLAMMYETLTMRSIFDVIGNNTISADSAITRDVLGGSEYNSVFRIFKENGYFNEALYFNQSYYMEHQGTWLDKSDVLMGYYGRKFSPLFYLGDWHRYSDLKISPRHIHQPHVVQMPQKMKASLTVDKKTPHFTIIKMGAGHTPLTHTYIDAKKWVASGEYQSIFRRDQSVMIPTLEMILSSYPQALIVLIGDHGATRFRGYASKYDVQTLDDLDRLAPVTGITKKDFMDDRFGVFMAIRMPYGMRNISHGKQMNNRNLFWHIFSELSEDTGFLKKTTSIDSVFFNDSEKKTRICFYLYCQKSTNEPENHAR